MAAMATVKSSTLTCLINHLLRHPKPFFLSVLTRKSIHYDEHRFPSFFPPIFSSLLVPKPFSSVGESEQDEDHVSLASLSENNDEEEHGSDRTMFSMRECGTSFEISEEMVTQSSSLKLSVKEKKKLASYAHSLGDKLKCQLVGKSGVTDSVVFSLAETLEKNELLKVKILRTCPEELGDMIMHLEEATGISF